MYYWEKKCILFGKNISSHMFTGKLFHTVWSGKASLINCFLGICKRNGKKKSIQLSGQIVFQASEAENAESLLLETIFLRKATRIVVLTLHDARGDLIKLPCFTSFYQCGMSGPYSQRILKQKCASQCLTNSSWGETKGKRGWLIPLPSSHIADMPTVMILNYLYDVIDLGDGKRFTQSALEGQYEQAPTCHCIHVLLSLINFYKCSGEYCPILCTKLSNYWNLI